MKAIIETDQLLNAYFLNTQTIIDDLFNSNNLSALKLACWPDEMLGALKKI